MTRKRRPGKPPILDTQLENIPEQDLARVGAWLLAKVKKDQWTTCASWLLDYLDAELAHRANGDDGPREKTLLVVPQNWKNREVADALECVTAISFAGTGTVEGVSTELGEFLNSLVIHIVAMTSDRLRSLADYHEAN